MKFPDCPKNPVCSLVAHVDKAVELYIESSTMHSENPAYYATVGHFMMNIIMEQGPFANLLRSEVPPPPLRCDGCIYTATHEDNQ